MSAITKDWVERLVATVAVTVLGIIIAELGSLDVVWVPVVVAALQIVKNEIARRFGDPNTAGFTKV